MEFSDPSVVEQGFQRISDHTYSASFEPSKPLDIEAVNLTPVKSVKWLNGENMLDWYFKPVEERYPLDPNFKPKKVIDDRKLYDEEEDLHDSE